MAIEQYLPPVETTLTLEPPELAVHLLAYLAEMERKGAIDRLHLRNFVRSTDIDSYSGDKSEEVRSALVEAWMWLEREGMLAPNIRQSEGFRSVTRRGLKLAETGDITVYARSNVFAGWSLDPILAEKAVPLFLRGDYDVAVFQAFKEIESRVRSAASLPAEVMGVDLMRRAFHPDSGALTDSALVPGERQAMSDLFAGVIGLFKNPTSHRNVNWEDPLECAELVFQANHLLRIVDRRAGN